MFIKCYNLIFQLRQWHEFFVTMFDGICDQTKELQQYVSMFNEDKLISSSSGRYMFVRFAVSVSVQFPVQFLTKIHYGKEILNQTLL